MLTSVLALFLGRAAPGPLIVILGLLAAGSAAAPAQAHDLPGQLLVQSFATTEGERLHLVTRVPLALLEGMALPKRGPGFLDLPNLDEPLERSAAAVASALVLHEDGAPLSPEHARWRVSLPSEDAFGSFEQARAHVLGEPLPDTANVFWNQGYFDVYYEYPLTFAQPDLAMQTQAHGLSGILQLQIEYRPADGAPRSFAFHADGRLLSLDPRWYHTALTFMSFGFDHLLQGIAHLLFLLCLVLPFRWQPIRSLLAAVAAFVVGHSLTLLAAGSGALAAGPWLPPLIELLVAVSIVYLAVENVVCAWFRRAGRVQLDRRWLIAGGFGLAYGFGFSFVLQEELQLAGANLAIAMLAFDAGLVLGQIAFLALALPALWLLLRHPAAQRAGVIIGSAFLAHTGWHWLLERLNDLSYYIVWPDLQVQVFLIGAAVVLALAPYLALRRGRAVSQQAERPAGSVGGD